MWKRRLCKVTCQFPPHPTDSLSLWVSISPPSLSFRHLLLPSSVQAMTFLAHCLPVHSLGYWAGRVQPHPGWALKGAPCHPQRLEWQRGCWKTQVKLLISRWGNWSQRGHMPHSTQQEPPCLSSKLSLCVIQFSSVQSLSHVRLFATPRIVARQASLSITNSQSSLFITLGNINMSHTCTCRYIYLYTSISIYRRGQWHPTPVFLPGKLHGQRSLVGCSPWGR